MENQQVRYQELEGQLNLLEPPAVEPPAVGDTSPPCPVPELPTGGNGTGRRGIETLEHRLLRSIKGSVILSPVTPDDLYRLEAGRTRRGVWGHSQTAKRVKRSAAEAEMLEVICNYAESFAVDIMGAVTFSDEYAHRHNIRTLESAVRDVHGGLRQLPMNHGKQVGYRGRFILAAEWHRTGRETPHVHFLLSSRGQPLKAVCEEFWGYFFNTRGRTRCEPIILVENGSRYALKDVLKQSIEHPEALDICTTIPKRVKHHV